MYDSFYTVLQERRSCHLRDQVDLFDLVFLPLFLGTLFWFSLSFSRCFWTLFGGLTWSCSSVRGSGGLICTCSSVRGSGGSTGEGGSCCAWGDCGEPSCNAGDFGGEFRGGILELFSNSFFFFFK